MIYYKAGGYFFFISLSIFLHLVITSYIVDEHKDIQLDVLFSKNKVGELLASQPEQHERSFVNLYLQDFVQMVYKSYHNKELEEGVRNKS